MRPTVYHIPVCPFSQRLEILLSLEDLSGVVGFSVPPTVGFPDARSGRLRGGCC